MKKTYWLATLATGLVIVGLGVAIAQERREEGDRPAPGRRNEGDRPAPGRGEDGAGPREDGPPPGGREGGPPPGGREGGTGGREGGPGGGRPGGQGGPGRGGPPGGSMKFMPVLIALDTDKNGEISADEIANAATSLKTLDKNGDGKLTEEEVRPTGPPPGGGRGGREGGPPPGGREGGPPPGGREGGPPPGGRDGAEGGERPRRPE